MKKTLVALFIFSSACQFIPLSAGWTSSSKREGKIKDIVVKCMQIGIFLKSIGAEKPAIQMAIFRYLHEMRSKASYEVLEELVEADVLPEFFLDLA